MSEKGQEEAKFRADAILVYRYIRDTPNCSAPEIMDAHFPVDPNAGPPSTIRALIKKSMRRVFRSITWLRAQGVPVIATPGGLGLAQFSIGEPRPPYRPGSVPRVNDFPVEVAEVTLSGGDQTDMGL